VVASSWSRLPRARSFRMRGITREASSADPGTPGWQSQSIWPMTFLGDDAHGMARRSDRARWQHRARCYAVESGWWRRSSRTAIWASPTRPRRWGASTVSSTFSYATRAGGMVTPTISHFRNGTAVAVLGCRAPRQCLR
jgi:hypothetical protein